MFQLQIPRTVIYPSLVILLLSSACQGDHPTSASTESTEAALAGEPVSAPTAPEQAEASSTNDGKPNRAHRVVDLAPPSTSAAAPPQNVPLVHYKSPLETGTHNVTKEKARKEFVASAPPPIAAKIDGAEQRRRLNRYLAKWEQEKGQHSALSEDGKEAAKNQLKQRVLGGQP